MKRVEKNCLNNAEILCEAKHLKITIVLQSLPTLKTKLLLNHYISKANWMCWATVTTLSPTLTLQPKQEQGIFYIISGKIVIMALEISHPCGTCFSKNFSLLSSIFPLSYFRVLLQRLWKSTVLLQVTMLYFSPLRNKIRIYTWNYS